jgi:hypothetical protein
MSFLPLKALPVKWVIFAASMAAIAWLSCHDDLAGISLGTSPPSVVSVTARALSANSALVTVMLRTKNRPTECHLEYGTTAAYGSRSRGNFASADTGISEVCDTLANLTPGETYHYRVVASSEGGSAVGPGGIFNTDSFLPRLDQVRVAVASGPIVVVTTTLWTLNRATQYYVEYGTTSALGLRSKGKAVAPDTVATEVKDTLNLPSGMEFQFRAVASSDVGITRSAYGLIYITDILQTLMNGDTIAWDYNGGSWTAGASTAYFRGPKTWRFSGSSVAGGVRTTIVEETFYGYRYRIDPVPRDTVWLGAVTAMLTIREAASGSITISNNVGSGLWGSFSAAFPRYWLGLGGDTEVAYGLNTPVTTRLRIHWARGLTYLRCGGGGGTTSSVCELIRQ